MRVTAGVWVRVALIVGAIGFAGLRDVTKPARADAPGPSFSVDLDPGQAGIQTTRSMPVGTPFSISVWLDTIGIPEYIIVDVKIFYDDARITAPLSGVPLDWVDPPEPGPIGGRIIPFVDPECPPFDAATAIQNEDGIGTASINISCYSSTMPDATPIVYTGSIVEFVLRCDSEGTSAVTIEDQAMFTTITEPFVEGGNSYFDHAHNATITCTPGGGDADSDGMPDVYESQYACLNVSIADATADPDADDYVNITEYQVGTNPCDLDTDNDGCADSEEDPSRSPMIGGQRDPTNGYDFYDVNGTKKVDGADIGLVRFNFNSSGPTPLEDLIYDRSTGAAPWAPNGPDYKINAVDIGIVRISFNHSCTDPPN
jgi:hypothetical protein